MGWRDLRNAPLIEAFRRYTDPRGTVLPKFMNSADLLVEPVSKLIIEDDWIDEWAEMATAFSDRTLPTAEYTWRSLTAAAFMVWEDMHEIVASDLDHLNRMIQMFPDTELAFRCEAAIRFHTFVPEGVGKQACAESKERPRRFA